jgi:hypothetical protein
VNHKCSYSVSEPKKILAVTSNFLMDSNDYFEEINVFSGDSVVKNYNKIKRQNVCLQRV